MRERVGETPLQRERRLEEELRLARAQAKSENRFAPYISNVWWSVAFAAVFIFVGVIFTRLMWGVPAAGAFVMGCLIGGLWGVVFWARTLLRGDRL